MTPHVNSALELGYRFAFNTMPFGKSPMVRGLGKELLLLP